MHAAQPARSLVRAARPAGAALATVLALLTTPAALVASPQGANAVPAPAGAGGAQAKKAKPATPAKPAAPPKPTGAPLGPDGMRVGTDLAKVGDSILLRTTWPPAGQARFVAAVRGKRLLLDLARVDLDVRKDTARARAYRTVIPAHSPLPVGTPFTLHGKFGTVTTRITGFDVWTSRVVATLELTPHIDSLAKKDDRMTAVAERDGVVVPASAAASPAAASPAATSPAVKGGAAPPSGATPAAGAATPAPSAAPTPGKGGPAAVAPDTTPCTRDSLGADLKAREKWLKDSLETVVKTTPRPAYTGFTKKAITRATRVQGCFGFGRLAMAVMLRDDRGEWFVERVVIVDDKGKVTPLKVLDLRFRAHELLGAYDVDGDGIDELATRATTERAGAVTILKLDLKGKKLERLAAGFAWEDF